MPILGINFKKDKDSAFNLKIRVHSPHCKGRKFSGLLSDVDLRVRKKSEYTMAALDDRAKRGF